MKRSSVPGTVAKVVWNSRGHGPTVLRRNRRNATAVDVDGAIHDFGRIVPLAFFHFGKQWICRLNWFHYFFTNSILLIHVNVVFNRLWWKFAHRKFCYDKKILHAFASMFSLKTFFMIQKIWIIKRFHTFCF